MKWSDFETRLRGEHLNGKRIVVIVARVEIEETHPRPGVTTNAPVLYFRNAKKSLVLSPTNQRTLAHLFGDDADNCVGRSIALEAKRQRVAGREVFPIYIYPAPSGTNLAELAQHEVGDESQKADKPAQIDAGAEMGNGGSPGEASYTMLEPEMSDTEAWPTTAPQFVDWLVVKKISGGEVHRALGMSAAQWLKVNAGQTYADLARTLAVTLVPDAALA